MRLSDFDYELPKELIAQYPLKERDTAKLLVIDRAKRTIKHCVFKDILGYLKKDDLIALNNTKVLHSRLKGTRVTGGAVEVLLLNRKEGLTFNSLIRPGRLKEGEKIIFNGGKAYGVVSARNEVTFNAKDADSVYDLGLIPLPPYIKRKPEDSDNVYYQTVYAKEEGAIASPTAGLHFTSELINEIALRAVNIAYITLHVGYATFKPVKSLDVRAHKMEPEYFEIPEASINLIDKAKKNNSRIFAVGTTSMRALETYCHGIKKGYTDLFIYPGYGFNAVSSLLTNFHLPRTTLYMLVCAFAGQSLIKEAYKEAIDKKYRFYSYGDAMLII